jgi:hypothetical protein
MKQILRVMGSCAVLMLAGCTINSSMLGDNVAGIGGAGTQGNLSAQTTGAPVSTGSIVPLNEEGRVVDLPDAGGQVQASSSYQEGNAQDSGEQVREIEQALSPDELHRRELINRGDLQEGEPLPVE